MFFKTLLTASALTAFSTMSFAQETGDIAVGVGVSNFGFNLEGAYQIDPQWRARGALMGGLSIDFEDESVEDGDGNFTLGGAALLADYYPLQNGWRVSGGLFLSNTELEASGTVATEAGDEEAKVTAGFANKIAPMITTGYDLAFGQGWAFTSEIGVILSGGIDIDYEATGAGSQDAIDNDPEVQDAIDEASDINALPYLSLGFSYKF